MTSALVQARNHAEDEVPEHLEDLDRTVPRLQRYRNNLTALSQKYNVSLNQKSVDCTWWRTNPFSVRTDMTDHPPELLVPTQLYFAAYEGTIHVYRPQGISHRIGSTPNIIITLAEQNDSQSPIPGYQCPDSPNHVNHMIVGLFGDEEILVTAADNGDVAAIYTKSVAERVHHQLAGHEQIQVRDLQILLLDNVQVSAWGLAIHAKSRLIAVSNNYHSVVVFAPALGILDDPNERPRPRTTGDWVRLRERNWRIMINLPWAAENVPNIAILDDDDGFADRVVCKDIIGATWVASIWSAQNQVVRMHDDALQYVARTPFSLFKMAGPTSSHDQKF